MASLHKRIEELEQRAKKLWQSWKKRNKALYWFISGWRYVLATGLGAALQKISKGGWIVILATFLLVLFFVILLYGDYRTAKKGKLLGFFWKLFCTCFVLVVSTCFFGHWNNRHLTYEVGDLKQQLKKRDDTISDFKLLFFGSHPKESISDLLGWPTETNTISITNQILIVKTNAVTVTATNFITIGSIQASSLTNVPFVLDFFQLLRIRSKLEGVSTIPITVISEPNDIDGSILARQIAQVFLQARFPTQIGIIASGQPPNSGVTVVFRNQTQGAINDVFMQIFKEFNQSPQYGIETMLMPTNAVFIFVSTTKTTTKK